MSKTDRERVRGELEQEIGSRATALVMELVPAMDWDAVATKQDLAAVKQDVAAVKQDVTEVKDDVSILKRDVAAVREDLAAMEQRSELRFTAIDGRFDVIDERFVSLRAEMGQMKYELLAAFRGELVTAVAGQTRVMVLTMAGTVTALGGLALALARLA
jgi:hypothetical protein